MLDSLREIFTLDQSTVRTGRRYFNLLARAIMLIATLAGMLLLNMAWSWLTEQSAKQLRISDIVQIRLAQAGVIVLVAVTVVALLFSIRDLTLLVWYELLGRNGGNEQP